MTTPADVQTGARSDSRRYYVAEIEKRVEALQAEQERLLDLVSDFEAEAFYTAPETKGALRDAAIGLGAIKRTLNAARAELPKP